MDKLWKLSAAIIVKDGRRVIYESVVESNEYSALERRIKCLS